MTDNFDDENDFRYILFNLAFGGTSNLTQSQYNIIASKCEVDTTTQYLLSGASSAYGIGDVILMRASSGDIQVVLRTGGKGDSEYICYNAVIIISNDLTYTSSVSQYAMQQLNNSTKDIALAISNQSGDNRIINFSTAGDGVKALMDDGTYKEVQARSDIENSFLIIVSQLARDQPATLSQSQYNTIKSLFKESTTSSLKIVRPSDSFVEEIGSFNTNDLTVIYDHNTGSINVLISGSGNVFNAGFIDLRIDIYSNLSVEYISSSMNIAAGDNSGITLARAYKSTEDNVDIDNQLRFMITGRGDNALMDNGSYQDIRGIDISSYLLEPDTITIVSSITKSKYDDIKSYILNNNHMYLSFSMSDSGTDVAFNSDIMASYIYDAAYLVFFDPNAQKMSKIKIDYNTYEVSTIVI